MHRYIINIILIIGINGCTTSHYAPKNNSKFAKNVTAKNLEGIYENKGQPVGFLSKLIFKNKQLKNINHEDIDLIQVLVNGKIFHINVIASECIVEEAEFVSGKDFKMKGGKIFLDGNFTLLGNQALGPQMKSVFLSIDEKGDAKRKSTETVVALWGVMIPLVGKTTSETEFKRVNSNQTYVQCREH